MDQIGDGQEPNSLGGGPGPTGPILIGDPPFRAVLTLKHQL